MIFYRYVIHVSRISSGDTESPSYAALCGSLNVKASRYAASLRVQRGGTEIITDLENMVKELLKAFYQTCGKKPKKILFYRDGVSESQFMEVLDSELTAIKGNWNILFLDLFMLFVNLFNYYSRVS
ncbi:MAG: hypothetical protein I3270_02345 [Candidatus Moeniiplasma glomeromycotorum]|nr:hypothetical protein [Candidatus Moeniiplasma glomeromycotorum]